MGSHIDFQPQKSVFDNDTEACFQCMPGVTDQDSQPLIFGRSTADYKASLPASLHLQRPCSAALSRSNSQASLRTDNHVKDLPQGFLIAKKNSGRVAYNPLSPRPYIRKEWTRPVQHGLVTKTEGSGFGSPIHGLRNIGPGTSFNFDSPSSKHASDVKSPAVACSSPGFSVITSEDQFLHSGHPSAKGDDELARRFISPFRSINNGEELFSSQSEFLCSDGSVSSEAIGSPDVCDLKQLMDVFEDNVQEASNAEEAFGVQYSTLMAVLSPCQGSLPSPTYSSPLELPVEVFRQGGMKGIVKDSPLYLRGSDDLAEAGFHYVFENQSENSGLSVEPSLAKPAGLLHRQNNNCNGLGEILVHCKSNIHEEGTTKATSDAAYLGTLSTSEESWLYPPFHHQALLRTEPDLQCAGVSVEGQPLKKHDPDYAWEGNVGSAELFVMQENRSNELEPPRLLNFQHNTLTHHPGQIKDVGWKGEIFEAPLTASPQGCLRSEGDDSGLRLVHLLIAGAEAVATRNMDLASVILVRLKELVSFSGSTMQRVAACFGDGLQCRIERDRCPDRAAGQETYSDILAAFQILHEISPYIKFGHFTANQAILEAVEGEKRIHIVDYEIMEGIQWPSLMQALVTRKGGPPHLRITALSRPHTKRGLATVQETGKRLTEFAASLNLPFTFSQLRLDKGEEFRESALRLVKGEALVVNCMVHLPHMPFRTATSVSSFLQGVRKLDPVVLTLVEEELGCNTPAISSYFFEALHHYSAFCDSLEACLASEPVGRMLVERVFLAPRITNAVTFCGVSTSTSDTGADFGKQNWCSLVSSAGFKTRPLSFHNMSQARLLLGLFRDGFKLDESGNRLLLGWHSKALIAASAWN